MSETILVVDDDDEFREALGEILDEAGYEVMLAASAPQAIELASRHRPGICLLDVAMPGVDGVQLLRYFRSRKVFREMPVILITAGIRKEGVHQALQAGVKDILLKSKFSVRELLERVHKRLSGILGALDESGSRSSVSATSDNDSSWGSESLVDTSSSDHEMQNTLPSGFDSSFDFDFRPDSEAGESGSTGGQDQRILSEEMIQAVGGLRALPAILEELIAVASDPRSAPTAVLEVVGRDPMLSARTIQAATSAGLRSGVEVGGLADCLGVLGVDEIVKIACTGTIVRGEDLDGDVGGDIAALWRQSIATGLVAEQLAPESEKAVAFLQGLFHDLPSLFALQYLGSDWPPWRSHALVKGWPLREAISNALGCPLESLSGQILDAYRIPSGVSSVIQEFQVHSLATNPRDTGRSVKLLEIARLLATALGRPGTLFAEVRSVHRDEAKAFDWDDIFRQDLSKQIGILEDLADLPPTEDDIRRIDRKLAIWRDPRWVVPDPVEMVLARYFDCLRVERFEDLVATKDRVRLAIGEPGTLEWERLGMAAPIIALHRGSLRPEPLPKGVDAMRVPLPVQLLVRRIEKAIP